MLLVQTAEGPRVALEPDVVLILANTTRHAARLGFALARTSQSAELGWSSWFKAAEQWLADNGCGPDAHLGNVLDAWRTERAIA